MDPTEIGTQSTLHPRTDISDGETPPLEQGDPWLDDGNVILEAEGKQFRVLRSILVSHSSTFRDVFALPQPAYEELVHGCPVVRISDTAEDTHHVLKALFDRRCAIIYGPSVQYLKIMNISVITAIALLATNCLRFPSLPHFCAWVENTRLNSCAQKPWGD